MKRCSNQEEFSIQIGKIVAKSDSNYLDAVLTYCQKTDTDPSDIKPLIDKSMKKKLELEFANLNFLEKKPNIADFIGG